MSKHTTKLVVRVGCTVVAVTFAAIAGCMAMAGQTEAAGTCVVACAVWSGLAIGF